MPTARRSARPCRAPGRARARARQAPPAKLTATPRRPATAVTEHSLSSSRTAAPRPSEIRPAAAGDAAVIDVRDVRKAYGDVKAVDGVTFRVEAGEIFGLLGPNGAGK